MLEFRSVSKKYPYEKFALIEDLSFTLEENEVLGIVTEKQCGKSTVAKLIAGLQKCSSGEILLDGKPLGQTQPKNRGFAVIYDDFALLKNRRYLTNAAYTLKIRGVKKKEREESALKALEKFGLAEKAGFRIKKKTPAEDKLALVLARASLREARLVVFDDVFKSAGRDYAKRLTELFCAGNGFAQVYLSSDITELNFCGRVIVVADGKNVFCGTPDGAEKFIESSHCFDILYGVAQ